MKVSGFIIGGRQSVTLWKTDFLWSKGWFNELLWLFNQSQVHRAEWSRCRGWLRQQLRVMRDAVKLILWLCGNLESYFYTLIVTVHITSPALKQTFTHFHCSQTHTVCKITSDHGCFRVMGAVPPLWDLSQCSPVLRYVMCWAHLCWKDQSVTR